MNDFYEKLKPRVQSECGELVEAFSTAKRQLKKTEKRLADDVALLDRISEQKQKLTAMADEAVVADLNKYKQFKASLKRLNGEYEATEEAIAVLRDKIIPSLKKEIEQTERKLSAALRMLVMESKPAIEQQMSDLMNQMIQQQDDFLGAFDRIHRDHGLTFVIHDPALIPRPQHARLKRLEIVGRSAEMRAAAMAANPPAATPAAVKIPGPVESPKHELTVMTGVIVK